MSRSSKANWAEPAADRVVWEQRDSVAAEVFTAQTEGSRFLDCRVITLSPSSMTASSLRNPPWNLCVNFSREKHKEMHVGWIAFQGCKRTTSDTMVAIKMKVKGPEKQSSGPWILHFLPSIPFKEASEFIAHERKQRETLTCTVSTHPRWIQTHQDGSKRPTFKFQLKQCVMWRRHVVGM